MLNDKVSSIPALVSSLHLSSDGSEWFAQAYVFLCTCPFKKWRKANATYELATRENPRYFTGMDPEQSRLFILEEG
jgi:hypothetical protein